MVESHMMQGFLTEGSADSGYGISLKDSIARTPNIPGAWKRSMPRPDSSMIS
jgi:hypothetical protein